MTGRQALTDGDVVVVSSKVVSKAAGLSRAGADRYEVIAEQTRRVVAERLTPRGTARIVEAPCGVVLAAAGVDASNVPGTTVLVLPDDPDAEAERLRRALVARTGARVGVIVSDTAGRAWRDGQVDFALGAAGLDVVDDLRGTLDAFGARLDVTVRAIADEVAAAADLVKGKVDGVPVALVRGMGRHVLREAGAGARALLRPPEQDWFRLGHVEAMRAGIGLSPGEGPEPLSVASGNDPAVVRLERAVRLAASSPDLSGDWFDPPLATDAEQSWVAWHVVEAADDPGSAVATLRLTDTGAPPAQAGVRLGALAQRALVLARSEGLLPRVDIGPHASHGGASLAVVITAR